MIDRYTKVCLTVIALSLVVIGFRGLSPVTDAVASNGVQKIAICDENGFKCTGIVGETGSFLTWVNNR